MRRLLISAAIVIATAASIPSAQAHQTGLADLRIEDATGARPLEGFVWYPTDATEGSVEAHGNQVWLGIDAIPDAEPAPGRFPLVVLSHGMYGNAMNQSWLAADLAARGFVVAAVSHPGTSTWSRDPDDARRMWERPKDVSRVIDHLLSASDIAAHVDPDRIYMAGHSLGGFTAVALAGGRYDNAGFEAFCADDPDELVCGIFARWHVAGTPEDQTRMEADLSDPRIDGFAIFDLGGTRTFSGASLAAINAPLLVFGAPRDIDGTGLDLDVESRALVAALPADRVRYLEPETLAHFDFLGECRPGALDILKEEEPDDVFVCVEGEAERRAEHAMIAREVAGFFDGIRPPGTAADAP